MKKVSVKIIAIMTICIMLCSTVGIAVSNSEIQQQKNEKNELNNQINEKKDELEDVKEEKSETMSQVEELIDKISNYEAEINELDQQISTLNKSITEAQERLNIAQKEYSKQEELLNERLVSMYEAGDTTYLDVLLSANDITDLISNWFLISELASYDTDMLEKIESQRNELESAKNELETNKSELNKTKTSKETTQSNLKAAKKEKDKKVAQLSENEKSLQEEIEELKNHESSISNRIKQMQEEYDRQNSNKNNNSSSNSNNGSSSFGFGWPVNNHTIGTGYGEAGPWWSSGYHTGVDFPVPSGTAVYAVGDGQVFDTGYNKAYGNFVEIYHGNNVYSFYAHASSVIVSQGQHVSKGQQIMLSGKTGNVTGAHLHFEIRTPGYKYANCVNPRPYLP